MWSGPRNISTALMRSWGSRADTFVRDEPFYAYYLTQTPHRYQHPGADEIIAVHEADWRKVVQSLTGDFPHGKTIAYQKQMSHHLVGELSEHTEWISQMRNAFLIREPREMIVSLAKVLPDPQLDQTGLPQQVALFKQICESTGNTSPVIDAADVLKDPRRMLSLLCEALDVPFDDAMLRWSPGPRETDGVWAKYWYAAVEQSNGFEPYQPKQVEVPTHLHSLLEEADALYQSLALYRLGQ
jgi:hypothetical protein